MDHRQLSALLRRLEARIRDLGQQYQREHLRVLRLERRISNLLWTWAIVLTMIGMAAGSALVILLLW